VSRRRFQEPAAQQPSDTPTRIVLTGARSAFIGPNLIVEPYRTAVATIVVGLDGDLSLRRVEDADVDTRPTPVVVVPPDTLCELHAVGDIALLFCDALRDDCSAIDLRESTDRIGPLRSLLKKGPEDRSPEVFLRDALERLGIASDRIARPEIMRIVSALGRRPELFANVECAARLAGLSPMRFQHVFTETVGIPFRRYRQWRRMGRVIRALADGENLTGAAYAAGFSNSAHLSSAFKAMFGLRPSTLVAGRTEYFLTDSEFGDANDADQGTS
jgi:AraC-like DNA-binding protein